MKEDKPRQGTETLLLNCNSYNLLHLMKEDKPRQGTETYLSRIILPSRQMKEDKPRQGTETYFFLIFVSKVITG